MHDRTILRGALTLGVVGLVAAALVASPVGAAGTLTKAKVKKIATKVFNKLIAPIEAGNQDKCTNGAVIAFGEIDVSAVGTSFGTAGVLNSFNCAGGAIESRKVVDGIFDVRVPGVTDGAGGSEGTVAAVTASDGSCGGFGCLPSVLSADYMTHASIDHIRVSIWSEPSDGLENGDFAFAVFNK